MGGGKEGLYICYIFIYLKSMKNSAKIGESKDSSPLEPTNLPQYRERDRMLNNTTGMQSAKSRL